jgi:hypothetical protein
MTAIELMLSPFLLLLLNRSTQPSLFRRKLYSLDKEMPPGS